MRELDGYDVKIFTDNIEKSAVKQIEQLISLDVFADKKIRIMPDVHAGMGCVIGFTGNLGDKVIPNIVGVDIGCGMRVLRLGNVGGIDFHRFNNHILENVPSGRIAREDKHGFKPLSGEEMDIYREAKELVTGLRCYRDLQRTSYINKSIGTLGGGNHFIEIDHDERDIYLVIHTGSRYLGKQVADLYQKLAVKHFCGWDEIVEKQKQLIEEYKAAGRRSEIQAAISKLHNEFKMRKPSILPSLCYLEDQMREDYLHDMRICQRWAVLNRTLIARLLMKFFRNATVEDEFESIHNYISDDNMIRKGAISAREGERCIIPLNMRDGALICTGKGNPDWNCSAPHGAGRVMSRTRAFSKITLEDFRDSMKGIYSESVTTDTRDESPMVYKPSDEIIANISDTVRIDTIIRPCFNFKAAE